MMDYVICGWASATGKTWRGTGTFTKQQAQDIADGLNAKNEGLSTHWAAPNPCEIHGFEQPCAACGVVLPTAL
jgi:hypothetical protein